MKRLNRSVLPALALASAAAATAAAQSIVEVARQERMRREALARQAGPNAPPPRVYTDADLIYSGLLTMRIDDAAAEAPAETGSAATGSETPPSEASAVGDEQRWRDRMTAARQALEEAERRGAGLQTRVNGLWADFTARDDPAQRAAIEQERQAALAELEDTTAEIDALAGAVADLRDEARRAGAPPGWLR